MIKSPQPQEKTTVRFGRKKFIILTGPKEGVTICHTKPQRKHQVLIRWHKTGVRGKPRARA